MKLPQAVEYCICTLEAAGFQAYAVGGCVRDSLLGLVPADYDLCTNARPEETSRIFAHHQLLHPVLTHQPGKFIQHHLGLAGVDGSGGAGHKTGGVGNGDAGVGVAVVDGHNAHGHHILSSTIIL